MSLQSTPSGERVHIGIFGRRNAGKSSLINAMTGQNLAIVSDIKGTTTDPVLKSMEILPLGPVVLMDTPGIDDEGQLGELRMQKTYQMLNKTDIAILVVDSSVGMTEDDAAILERIREKQIPYVVAWNKCDLLSQPLELTDGYGIQVSSVTGEGVQELKEMVATRCSGKTSNRRIVGDLLKPMDFVVLVTPIDQAAPKGRLILPQQQTIRDILDVGAVPIVVRDTELKQTLWKLQSKPAMVITDSQVFGEVSKTVPLDIPLTSFSILMARYKGDLRTVVEGAYMLNRLQEGDKVLIAEGCTHHRQCEDIGTVKLPRWISEYTRKELQFDFTSGTEFPDHLSKYQLIIHCGGCMLNEREMKYRLQCAKDQMVPITNYGTVIAHMRGILMRSLEPFR